MVIEIISGLLICTIDDLFDKSIYEKHSIDLILNCSIDLPFVDIPKVEKIRLPLKDMMSLKNNQNKILNFIHNNYLDKNILIASNEDYNIVICALFLIKYGSISVVDIQNIMKMKHDKLIIDRNLNEFL
jgi:hypothetical protein